MDEEKGFVSREINNDWRRPNRRKHSGRTRRSYRLYGSALRRSSYGRNTSSSGLSWGKRFGIKTGICVGLVALCLFLKFSGMPAAERAMGYLQGVITYDMDFSQPFGELKFVENIFPQAGEVFGGETKTYGMPFVGEVVRGFGEEGSMGLSIAAGAEKQQVAACGPGQVAKRGTSSTLGNYVRISHPDGMETSYYGLAESPLKEGDTVEKGAVVGILQEKELYLEFTKNSIPKDPMNYIAVE
jgi:murein DD-endopeptidase MepM/ murein hydrolase activator NlpD